MCCNPYSGHTFTPQCKQDQALVQQINITPWTQSGYCGVPPCVFLILFYLHPPATLAQMSSRGTGVERVKIGACELDEGIKESKRCLLGHSNPHVRLDRSKQGQPTSCQWPLTLLYFDAFGSTLLQSLPFNHPKHCEQRKKEKKTTNDLSWGYKEADSLPLTVECWKDGTLWGTLYHVFAFTEDTFPQSGTLQSGW